MAALLGKALKFALPFGLAGVVGSLIGGGKKKPIAAQALPQATRDDASALAAREDEIRRRQGAAADLITGVTGAEGAFTPGKFNPLGN